MQQGVKFTEVWHIMCSFASTLIWYHTHIQTYINTHNTLRGQQTDKPIQIYINAICYVLKTAICILLNKWLTDIKSLLYTVLSYSYQKLLTCRSQISVD